MKKILLTGSRGFTGKYVSEVFRKDGYDVIGVVQDNPGKNEIKADLRDKEGLVRVVSEVKPAGIIHLAALSFVGHGNPLDFYEVNVLGTTNLLEAVTESGIKLEKCIIASSANIYGNLEKKSIKEDELPHPVNHYAMSKLAMEFMIEPWFKKIPICIVRPFNYTGPGQNDNFLIPKIVKHYREKCSLLELGNLDVARDFSDVRDIARYYLGLYKSEMTNSQIVNLCSGNVVKLQDAIKIMNNVAGYKIEVRINPDFVRSNEIKVLGGDPKRLKELTNIVPKYSFEMTVKDMYESDL